MAIYFENINPEHRKALKDAIVEARDLLKDPNRWVKKAYSIPAPNGTRCFCLMGAVAHCMLPKNRNGLMDGWSYDFRELFKKATGEDRGVEYYNDFCCETNEDAVKALDQVIGQLV